MPKCENCGKEFEGESWKRLCNDCFIKQKEEKESKEVNNEPTEKSIEPIDLNKLKKPTHPNLIRKTLVESGLITNQGVRVQGIGILIRKLEKLIQLQNSTTNYLHHLENKVDKLIEKWN